MDGTGQQPGWLGVSTGSFDLGVGVGEGLFGTVYGLCTPLATVYMNYVTKF